MKNDEDVRKVRTELEPDFKKHGMNVITLNAVDKGDYWVHFKKVEENV
jgi:hypothetical protein